MQEFGIDPPGKPAVPVPCNDFVDSRSDRTLRKGVQLQRSEPPRLAEIGCKPSCTGIPAALEAVVHNPGNTLEIACHIDPRTHMNLLAGTGPGAAQGSGLPVSFSPL